MFREGFTPAPLGNVCYFCMWIWCNIDDKLVAAMTSLFRAVPNLTTLAVSSYPEFPFLGGGTNVSIRLWNSNLGTPCIFGIKVLLIDLLVCYFFSYLDLIRYTGNSSALILFVI